jgi:hypothetical protein
MRSPKQAQGHSKGGNGSFGEVGLRVALGMKLAAFQVGEQQEPRISYRPTNESAERQ